MKRHRVQIALLLTGLLACACGPARHDGGPHGGTRGEAPAEEAASRGVVREGAGPRRWALLIGVNDYAELEDLKYCSRDMQALAEALAGVGFPAEHIFTLHNETADSKNLPFKANIEK